MREVIQSASKSGMYVSRQSVSGRSHPASWAASWAATHPPRNRGSHPASEPTKLRQNLPSAVKQVWVISAIRSIAGLLLLPQYTPRLGNLIQYCHPQSRAAYKTVRSFGSHRPFVLVFVWSSVRPFTYVCVRVCGSARGQGDNRSVGRSVGRSVSQGDSDTVSQCQSACE